MECHDWMDTVKRSLILFSLMVCSIVLLSSCASLHSVSSRPDEADGAILRDAPYKIQLPPDDSAILSTVFENKTEGEATSWVNQDRGVNYMVTVVKSFYDDKDRLCRDFILDRNHEDTGKVRWRGDACKAGKKEWTLHNVRRKTPQL
jgi:methionine-rich copper-binding protein CopC